MCLDMEIPASEPDVNWSFDSLVQWPSLPHQRQGGGLLVAGAEPLEGKA